MPQCPVLSASRAQDLKNSFVTNFFCVQRSLGSGSHGEVVRPMWIIISCGCVYITGVNSVEPGTKASHMALLKKSGYLPAATSLTPPFFSRAFLLLCLSSSTLLWHLLFSPSLSPIFFYSSELLPDLFMSSSFSLFDLFCMNDFVVETPAFLGVVFFSGQSIRVDAKSNLIFEWRCAQCQVLVALKCELFSTSF